MAIKKVKHSEASLPLYTLPGPGFEGELPLKDASETAKKQEAYIKAAELPLMLCRCRCASETWGQFLRSESGEEV